MNFLLQFKDKKHAEAYSHDIQLQVNKRLAMVVTWFSLNITANLILFGLYRISLTNPVDLTKLSLLLASIITLLLVKYNIRRVQKYIRAINFILDMFLFYVIFVFFPLLGAETAAAFGKLGIFVLSWCTSLGYYSIYYFFTNGWLRAIAPVVQIGFYLVFVMQTEILSKMLVIIAVESLVIYLLYIYINERYQRIDFLEKRRAYENSEAIKKIFDDIIQGIMIIDQQCSIVYSNQTVYTMLGHQQHQLAQYARPLDELFSQLFIKAISPRMEAGAERIRTTRESDDEAQLIQQNTLGELLEPIADALFHPTAPISSVTAETYRVDHSSPNLQNPPESSKRTFFIKFTTSFYMEKKVIVINITDTTDRDSLIAAQASNEYKSRLLSSVSHELRTPLNGSINFIEQILNERALPKQVTEKWLIPALRCNKLLLSLVNDILDFSQMHAGKLRLVCEPRNIVETAKECLELLEIQANKKNLKLSLQNNLNLDSEIMTTDHNRLRQVILNLLSNAVKFTFRGSVTLVLDPVNRSLNPSHAINLEDDQTEKTIFNGVRITVKDTGIGINQENQKRLFQAFEKLELGHKSVINATGAGLGLLISNNLVQRLSPEELADKDAKIIKFESREKVGSSFYFEIYSWKLAADGSHSKGIEMSETNHPDSIFSEKGLETGSIQLLTREFLDANANSRGVIRRNVITLDTMGSENIDERLGKHYTQPLIASPVTCKCNKMLIVDDDPFNLTALDQILNKLHIQCDWAFNGQEAIEKILFRQRNPCCSACQQYKAMFLDCSMPILDGFETAARLRQMINNREIDNLKIIACTAFVQQSDEDKARAAGMDDFCTKPIKMTMIKEKLFSVGFFE